MPIQIKDRIQIKNNLAGIVRYIGPVEGKEGEWIGLELDEAKGSNDGKVQGKRYFYCAENRGLFVRYEKLTKNITKIDEDSFMSHSCENKRINLDNTVFKPEKYKELIPTFETGKYEGYNTFNSHKNEEENKYKKSLFEDDEENERLRETLERIMKKWNESLEMIQKRLEVLKRRVDEIKPNRKIEDKERMEVIKLVEKIIEKSEKKEESEELYKEFKEMMDKYKIKVDI